MALYRVKCAWCQCDATVFWNNGEIPQVWVCEICSQAWRARPISRIRNKYGNY